VGNSSPEVQRSRNLARIAAEGWELATDVGDGGVIFDLDESGSDKGLRLQRPGLLLARDAVKTGKADVIVALRLDRLARNTVDLLMLAEELDQHGGAFALAEGDISTAGPYGKLILTMIAAIAELEARIITERTMAGRDAAREQDGRWVGGRSVPFGYRRVPHPTIKDAVTIEPDPGLTDVVAHVVDLLGQRRIMDAARYLSDNGVATVRESTRGWRRDVVLSTFTHEAMVGRVWVDGDVLRDAAGMPREVFAPLISEAQRQHLLAVLPKVRRSRDVVRGAASPVRGLGAAKHLLSGGVARCASCDGPMVAAAPDRYRCDRRKAGVCPAGANVRRDQLDLVVTDRFLTIAGNLHVATVVTEAPAPDAGRRADLTDALRAAKAAVADAIEAQDEQAEANARSLVHALRAELDTMPADTAPTTRRVYSNETYAELWQGLDTAGRRELLAELVTVKVSPATVRIHGSRFDASRPVLEARVATLWSDELEHAALAALDPEPAPAPTRGRRGRAR
jgi:DNA invertase Pin-like site-specific DNA recombinase